MDLKSLVVLSDHCNSASMVSVTHLTSCCQKVGLFAGLSYFIIIFHIVQIVMCHKPVNLSLSISSYVGGLSFIPLLHIP